MSLRRHHESLAHSLPPRLVRHQKGNIEKIVVILHHLGIGTWACNLGVQNEVCWGQPIASELAVAGINGGHNC